MDKEEGKAGIAMRAGESDLRLWLTNPPEQAKGWKRNHQPLLRCCELDSKDLFVKWYNWGCRGILRKSVAMDFRTGNLQVDVRNNSALKNVTFIDLFNQNPKSALWLFECERDNFLGAVSHLVKYEENKILQSIDWDRILKQTSNDETATLAIWSLLSKREFLHKHQLDRSLEILDGELVSGGSKYTTERIFSTLRGWQTIGLASDNEAAQRIDGLEYGLLRNIDWRLLIKFSYPLSIQSAREQIKFNNHEIKASKSAPSHWVGFFNSLKHQSLKNPVNANEGVNLLEALVDCGLDIGKTDKDKQNIFYAVFDLVRYVDIETSKAMGRFLYEQKPALIKKKSNKHSGILDIDRGDKSEIEFIEYLKMMESRGGLINAKKHQFGKKMKENKSAPRKRKLM